MSKNFWAAGTVLWLAACGVRGGEGPLSPEEKKQQARRCILQSLPRPEGSQEWEVSGYVLVGAYVSCQGQPGDATSSDFRAVVEGMAHPVEGDRSKVRLVVPAGDSP